MIRALFAESTSGLAQEASTFGETVEIGLEALEPADSPRLNGIDVEHVRRLAQGDAVLPPILVDRSTRRVIDGAHRIAAARMPISMAMAGSMWWYRAWARPPRFGRT